MLTLICWFDFSFASFAVEGRHWHTRLPCRTKNMDGSRIIGFNVGGTVFETTLATLKTCGECVLSRMVESADLPVIRDTNGRIFLDRNPRIFEYVLDYLRRNTRSLLLDTESEAVRKTVEEELGYFCIGHQVLSDVAIRQALTGRHLANIDSWLERYDAEVKQITADVLSNLQELAESRKLLETRCGSYWYGSSSLENDVAFPDTYRKKKDRMKNTCQEWFSDYRKTFSSANENAHLVLMNLPTEDLMRVMVSITKNLQLQSLTCEVVTLFQILSEKESKTEFSEMETAFRFFQRRVFGIKWTGKE